MLNCLEVIWVDSGVFHLFLAAEKSVQLPVTTGESSPTDPRTFGKDIDFIRRDYDCNFCIRHIAFIFGCSRTEEAPGSSDCPSSNCRGMLKGIINPSKQPSSRTPLNRPRT